MNFQVEPLAKSFGAVISPGEGNDLISEDSSELAELFRKYRCLVFRGFHATVDDFQRLTSMFTSDFQTYQGGGFTVGPFSRSTVGNNKTLLTATGKTQEFALPLHGELYYLGKPPDLIWFYSARSVSEGGETTVGDGAQIFRDLSESTARRFTERGIRYQRRLASGDWQAAFQTEDASAVEAFCKAQGLELTWDADGSAVTHFRSSALRTDDSRNPAFISSLVLLALAEWAIVSGKAAAAMPEAKDLKPDFVVRWDDGSPLEPTILKDVVEACARNEVAVSWTDGDIMMVDNRSIMHGRRASSGRDRQILVRMGSLKPQAAAA
jgi:alpha-ketoglutarate-dependent taurine dioxygenase